MLTTSDSAIPTLASSTLSSRSTCTDAMHLLMAMQPVPHVMTQDMRFMHEHVNCVCVLLNLSTVNFHTC